MFGERSCLPAPCWKFPWKMAQSFNPSSGGGVFFSRPVTNCQPLAESWTVHSSRWFVTFASCPEQFFAIVRKMIAGDSARKLYTEFQTKISHYKRLLPLYRIYHRWTLRRTIYWSTGEWKWFFPIWRVTCVYSDSISILRFLSSLANFKRNIAT